MLHRIREAWVEYDDEPFDGLAEVDETHMGGKRKHMSNAKRKQPLARDAALSARRL